MRRQLAKSNFDLDSQDLQTLALALECKSHKATSDVNEPKEMKAPDETQVTPKKKRPAKSKSKKAAKAPAQPAPKCKSKAKAKKKKKNEKENGNCVDFCHDPYSPLPTVSAVILWSP